MKKSKKKFLALLSLVFNVGTAVCPVRSMAMKEKLSNTEETGFLVQKENHVLTFEEYKNINDKNVAMYKDDEGFLIDENMNYLDAEGNELKDDCQDNRVKVEKMLPSSEGKFSAYHVRINKHPVIETMSDNITPEYRQKIYKISTSTSTKESTGNEKCVIILDNLPWKRVLTIKDKYEINISAYNDNMDWVKETVFFPKKMLEKYNLTELGPDEFNKIKNLQEKALEESKRKRESEKLRENHQGNNEKKLVETKDEGQFPELNASENSNSNDSLAKVLLGLGLVVVPTVGFLGSKNLFKKNVKNDGSTKQSSQCYDFGEIPYEDEYGTESNTII